MMRAGISLEFWMRKLTESFNTRHKRRQRVWLTANGGQGTFAVVIDCEVVIILNFLVIFQL